MKKITLLLVLFFTTQLFSNEFNIESALQEAKKLNRPIFYIVASSSCPHCHKYISGAIVKNADKLKKDYVVATCDIGKGEQVFPPIPFSGTAPTTYLLLPNGKLATQPIVGEIDTATLSELLEQFSNYFKNKYKSTRR